MNLSRRLAAGAAIGVAALSLAAAHTADPTFAEDVAPIFYKNCTVCHHSGGVAPFSLVDFDSVQFDDMKEAITTGKMPPWGADGPKGVFKNDRRLADADRQTILRWLETGAKPGDLKKLPPRPSYPTSWAIGQPDLVVTMPEAFEVPATGTIEYMYFEAPTNLTEEKWVSAVEIMPGAREVVHHVIVHARVPRPAGAAVPAPQPAVTAGAPATPPNPPTPLFIRNRAHALPPEPPRSDSLHAPPRQLGVVVGTTAPGTNVMEFPVGTALRLRPGTVIIFEVHYTTHGTPHKDRTSVGFKFTSEPQEEMFVSQFTNGSFTIPAGAKDVAVPSELGIGQPAKIYGLLPHTHLRGTRWKYTLDHANGASEVILDVPRYDFNWQLYYLFAKPLELQPGDKINAMAWYDNSASNKSNPNPKVDVKWGDQTWEEMQYTGFLYSVPGRRIR